MNQDENIRRNLGEARKAGVPGMLAEIAARVVAERFPDTLPSYRHVWYNRFARGNEWHYGDSTTRRVILRVLTTPWGGTAKCLDIQEVRDFLAEVDL